MTTKKKSKKKAPKKRVKTLKKPAKAKSKAKKATHKPAAKKTVAPKRRLAAKAVTKAAGATAKNSTKRRLAGPRGKSEITGSIEYEVPGLGARSGGQSGDLQGLSNVAGADSESVDELLEEGNAFEAEIVKGVQDVRDADEGEIVTHEVPEDDVPREYDEQ
jgi:membrane protein involved in colicin uptake